MHGGISFPSAVFAQLPKVSAWTPSIITGIGANIVVLVVFFCTPRGRRARGRMLWFLRNVPITRRRAWCVHVPVGLRCVWEPFLQHQGSGVGEARHSIRADPTAKRGAPQQIAAEFSWRWSSKCSGTNGLGARNRRRQGATTAYRPRCRS